MKLFNPIEKIVRRLGDIENDIDNAAALIEAKLADLPHAGNAACDIERIINEERDMLLTKIKRRFTDSEIEAADVMCNRCNDSGLWANAGRVGQGADRFRLAIDHAGGSIRYVPDGNQVSAHVFAHYNLNTGRAVVLMIAGTFGASITNAADRIIPFIQRQHIGRRGIRWKDVMWIYLDTMKAWDQILVTDFDGGTHAAIGFAPLGNRTELDAMTAMSTAGIVLDSHDLAHIRRVL